MSDETKFATVAGIQYHLPEDVWTTERLAAAQPDWGVAKIDQRTGVGARHIAAPGECASDLAAEAAKKLFTSGACSPADIDFLLLCTETPDYFLPPTACLLQDRLGIPTTAGALDYNLGHSGFIYGLGLANGLVASGQASNVLLLTAETYSKFIHPLDRSVRTIFGDGAAATLVRASGKAPMGPFLYGTDGRGAQSLIVPAGGMREPRSAATAVESTDDQDNVRSRDNLLMVGPDVFAFTLEAVPSAFHALLAKAGTSIEDIDLFVFHQANGYILEQLRRKIKIPAEKFVVALSHCGNTVSSSIPIALREALNQGKLQSGMRVMLLAYGVGFSWAGMILNWPE